MKLSEMAERTGLPLRRLRYALDHDVVPPERLAIGNDLRPGSGSRREFSPFGAFLVVFAAALLEHGLSQSVTRALVDRFCTWAAEGRAQRGPMLDAFAGWLAAREASVTIGDRSWMKIDMGTKGSDTPRMAKAPKPMPWTDLASGERLKHRAPLVTTVVDLGELVRRLTSET